MHNRITDLYHQLKSPQADYVDLALILPQNKIALREDYTHKDSTRCCQRILVRDLVSMKPLATLLPDKCYVTSMKLLGEDHIGIVYYHLPETNYLGIWEIKKILAGETAPKFLHVCPISEYWAATIGLPNGEMVYALTPGQHIDFYFEQLNASIPSDNTSEDELLMTATDKALIYAKTVQEREINYIQITAVDLFSKKINETFFVDQNDGLIELYDIMLLQNKYIGLSYAFFTKDVSDEDLKTHDFVNIWNLESKEKIHTLDVHDSVEHLAVFPSDDFVTLSNDGALDYWNTAFQHVETLQLSAQKPFHLFEMHTLENHALLISEYDFSGDWHFLHVAPNQSYLENQNNILRNTCNILAPRAKIPEINHIIRNYLGFFSPKKLCNIDCDIIKKDFLC